jgi:hypothetical protein
MLLRESKSMEYSGSHCTTKKKTKERGSDLHHARRRRGDETIDDVVHPECLYDIGRF